MGWDSRKLQVVIFNTGVSELAMIVESGRQRDEEGCRHTVKHTSSNRIPTSD